MEYTTPETLKIPFALSPRCAVPHAPLEFKTPGDHVPIAPNVFITGVVRGHHTVVVTNQNDQNSCVS